MNSLRSRFMPSSNGRSTAASTAWMPSSGASKPRNLRALALRNSSKISRLAARGLDLVVEVAHLAQRLRVSTTFLAKATAPSRSLPPRPARRRGPIRAPAWRRSGCRSRDHLQRLLDADDARQPLRAAGAGQQAELDLGQAELARTGRRRGSGSAERDLEAAAERRAVDRGDDRLGAALDRVLHVVERGAPWAACRIR